MNTDPAIKNTAQIEKLLFLLIIICAAFWIVANTVNVYRYAVTGAVFEIMWLPLLLATFSIPLLSIVCWYKNRFSLRSPFLYLAMASAVLLIFLMRG